VSEVDVEGHMLKSFTDIWGAEHLAIDNYTGQVIVADGFNNRVLLLNSQLQLERVLIDRTSQDKYWHPFRLYHRQLTSRLYVLHRGSDSVLLGRDVVTEWII